MKNEEKPLEIKKNPETNEDEQKCIEYSVEITGKSKIFSFIEFYIKQTTKLKESVD